MGSSNTKTIFRRLGVAGALLMLGLAGSAHAASIPGLFNTGVDNAGVALGDAAPDPHYSMVDQFVGTPVTITTPHASWFPNNLPADAGPDYRWIWQNADGSPLGVTRTFRTTFDLTGLDPSTATISGRWSTDNFGDDILLNGTSNGQTCSTFTGFCPFLVSSGFVAGSNALDFVVRDVGGIAGFQVSSISGAASPVAVIPEPSTYALMLAGLGLVGFAANRRRKARPNAA